MSAEKPIRPYGFCSVCAQAVSVNIHGGATQHGNVAHTEMCSGSELGMDRSIAARDARVKAQTAAEALTEAADFFESGDLEFDDLKSRDADAPKGWSNDSIAAAIQASGPVMDWLRARAAEYRERVK